MKLFYRGASYEYDPSDVKSRKTGWAGKQVVPQSNSQLTYRGVTYHPNLQLESAEVPARQPAYNLSYRGATYSMNKAAQAEAIEPRITTKVGTISVAHVLTPQNVAKVHYANMLENLQHRLQVARERGDQTLVNLLEAEQKQITSSWDKSKEGTEATRRSRNNSLNC